MGDWKETTIGSQATLQRGFDITRAEQRVGTVPVVSSGGISSYHDRMMVKGPGVVLGRKGVVGSVYYIQNDYWPHDTTLWVRDFHDNDRRFVYYFFMYFAPRLSALDVGSANPTLNRNHVHPAKVLWPSISLQRQIADLLGVLDDKIELNRRMNATLEAMALALFKDWFVDFGPTRAKAEGHPPYLAPDLWALFPDALDDDDKPVGWVEEPVFEQANWVNGAAYKNMHFTDDPDALPVAKIAELKNGITSTTKFTKTALGERYQISRGELLFSWSGNPDTSIDTFVWPFGDAWLNQHIFAVRENGSRSRCFLHAMLKWLKPEFAEIARNKQTTGLGHVTQEDLKRLTIVIPSPKVEQAFENVANPIYSHLCANLYENLTLSQTRDLLLPKLMSGEIRLRDAEKAVEAVA